MPEIRCQGVSLTKLQGGLSTEILRAVGLTARQGEIYTVIGPSGSGKSTLLRLINRLLEPSSGTIFFAGSDIRRMPVTEVRRKIGLVFQQPMLFPGSVEENLCYGPRLRGDNSREAAKYLDMVGLERELLQRDAAALSGGQQQRVALARALANKPEALLLDEPTSALDPRATEQLEDLILGLVQSLRLTVVWVTHNMEQAKRVGDRTMLLVNGQVVEERPTADFFSWPEQELTIRFLAGKLESGVQGNEL